MQNKSNSIIRLILGFVALFVCGQLWAQDGSQDMSAPDTNSMSNVFQTDKPGSFVVGAIRIQFISDSLVRLEQKGPKGFEDRNTFHIVDRSGPGTELMGTKWTSTAIEFKTAGYTVRIPVNPVSKKSEGVQHYADPVSLEGMYSDKIKGYSMLDSLQVTE